MGSGGGCDRSTPVLRCPLVPAGLTDEFLRGYGGLLQLPATKCYTRSASPGRLHTAGSQVRNLSEDAISAAVPIVVVSRSEAACRLLHLLLGQAGYASIIAADEDEALALISSSRPAVVVIDLRDPDEEMLFFAALVNKRHPGVARLMLHVGSARLVSGAVERHFSLGGAGAPAHFPSVDELRRAVALAVSDQLLAAFNPVPAKA